jgi:hypothetical protein
VGLERGLLSHVSTIEELLERASSGSSLESLDYSCRGSSALTATPPLSTQVGTNFADKQRLLSWYNSFAGSGHGVCLFVCLFVSCFKFYEMFFIPYQTSMIFNFIIMEFSFMKAELSLCLLK